MNDTLQTLITEHMSFAKKLAMRRKRSLPTYIDLEELVSAAYLGLTEAASRYDRQEVKFTTFAFRRIDGAISDYLRSLGQPLISLDACTDKGTCLRDAIVAKQPSKGLEEMVDFLAEDIGGQANVVMRSYYVEELSLREVGEKIGVCESRVSQLLSQYRKDIRNKWGECELRAELAA